MFKVTLRRKEDELGPEETSHGERVLLLFSRSVVSDSLPPTDCSTPGLPVLHHLPELAQTHVH